MSETLHDEITYGTARIPFTTVFADRTTLEIGVDPDGSVLVKAPTGTPYVTVRRRVAAKARWIERQRVFFDGLARPVTPRYVSGETHRYLGRQYRLKVETAPRPEVKLTGPYFVVGTPDGSPEQTARALDRWFRERAGVKIAERVDVCAARVHYLGIRRPEIGLRRMATRWGSRTPDGRILFHPDLVRAPVACVDYVVLHELCHGLHSNHGQAFYALLTHVLPDWQTRRDRLNGVNW